MLKKLLLPLVLVWTLFLGAGPLAANTVDNSSSSSSIGKPPAPGDLRVTRIEPRLVVLNWQPVPGARIYKVTQFREIDGIERETTSTNISGLWRVESLLLPETEYRFEIAAISSAGVLGSPASVEATTAALPVFKPEIALNSVSDSVVRLTWFQRPQVEAYDIYRDGELLVRETVTLSGYSDLTAKPDTTYRYQVAEVIGDRASPLSDELIVRTLPAGAFGNPPPVEVTFSDRRRIVLRVGPVSPQPRGQTHVRISGGNLGSLTVPVPQRGDYPYIWITDRDLTPGTAYSYDVGYVEADGTVPTEVTVSAATEGLNFEVQGLTVTFTDRSRVVLRMDNPTGASTGVTFIVERDGDILETVDAGTGSQTWFTDHDLEAGSTHSYRVAMEVGGQRGPFSDAVVVTLSS